jgi:hypothetical protein
LTHAEQGNLAAYFEHNQAKELQMSVQLDNRVTPSLHPANVTNLDGYNDATAGYVAGVERAFTEAYNGISAVFGGADAVKRDLSLTDAGRTIKIDDMAQRVFAKVSKLFDAENVNLSKGIAQIEEKLTAPINARAAHPIAAEVRAHMRAMSETDRTAFIMRAIDSGDTTTVESVLGAPSYLSGLRAEAQAALLRMYHEKAAPDEAARLKVMKAALALLGARAGLLFTSLEQAVGAKPHEAQRLREAKARADKALAA